MTFRPAFEIITADPASASRSLFLLHGIFGAARNWRSFARRLAERCPQWRIVAIDLREHGRSTGAPPPHTIAACAADLSALEQELGAPQAVCGHSFGGKVALAYAAVSSAPPLEQVWILDSPLVAVEQQGSPAGQSEAGRALQAMKHAPLPAASRSAVTGSLTAAGVAPSIATWLATNLVADAGGYRWSFDLDALGELLADYWTVDGYQLLERIPAPAAVHLVRAGRSDRWTADDLQRIDALVRTGRLTAHLLPDAAHWLHVDDPDGLLDLLAPYFGGAPAA